MASKEYRAWVARDVKKEEERELTPKERRRNWWYYHKWWVLGGIVLAGILIQLAISALGIGKIHPDYQIAYVGSYPLPEETAQAVCAAFERFGEDLNGDGSVIVQLNQYAAGSAEALAAAEVQLMVDLSECESYFLLLEDPDDFQRKQQCLALPDGGCPGIYDLTGMDKVFRWDTLSALASQELGQYEALIPGQSLMIDNQELLASLYLGRRCFYPENKNQVYSPEGCARLWDKITEGVS